jgi:hypothetical protein
MLVQVAVDQCKSLLHAGLAAVGYSAVGFKLLLQSAESVAQRILARRGCLFKVVPLKNYYVGAVLVVYYSVLDLYLPSFFLPFVVYPIQF